LTKVYTAYLLIKRVFDTTLTEEKAIARAAIPGLESQPIIRFNITYTYSRGIKKDVKYLEIQIISI